MTKLLKGLLKTFCLSCLGTFSDSFGQLLIFQHYLLSQEQYMPYDTGVCVQLLAISTSFTESHLYKAQFFIQLIQNTFLVPEPTSHLTCEIAQG